MKKVTLQIKGITPMVMHSDRLCNPLDPLTKKMKEISSLKKKKDEHHYAMSKIEFTAALYYDEEFGIHVPDRVIFGTFKSAAKKFRLGKSMKSIVFDEIGFPIEELKGETPASLWEKKGESGQSKFLFCQSVVVQRARIIRSRPIIHKWTVNIRLLLDEELLALDQLKTIIDTAGAEFGIGDIRPGLATGSYGKFELTKFEVK